MMAKKTLSGKEKPHLWERTLERTGYGETKAHVLLWRIRDGDAQGYTGDFAIITLSIELSDETVWQTTWKHYISYLIRELKPYIDKYCPLPEEVYPVFLDCLPPEIREKFPPMEEQEEKKEAPAG